MLTGRAENHIRGVDDLDDTIERLIAYREAGADCVYAPGLTDLEQIRRVVDEVGRRSTCSPCRPAPTIGELEAVGVRRDLDRQPARGRRLRAAVAGAPELHDQGTSKYAAGHVPRDLLTRALSS